jgi:hypothetical protein
VKTRHKNKSGPGQTIDELRTHLDDLARSRPCGQVLIGFALDFASAASDAFFGILKQIVLTHAFPPEDGVDGRWVDYKAVTLTKVS